jgi:hypothetical protein
MFEPISRWPRFEGPPGLFEDLLAGVHQLRTRTGRPHWLLVDEAHSLLPAVRDRVLATLCRGFRGVILVSYQPEQVAPSVLASVDVALTVGESAAQTLASFAAALGQQCPLVPDTSPTSGHALAWNRRNPSPPFTLRMVPPEVEHRRHRRKYAKGDLGAEHSFYFRGPQEQLHLRAANLMTFIELADRLDDEAWEFHLRRGDYERWFRETVKDDELAAEAAETAETRLAPADSRVRIRAAIEKRYAAPA